MMAVDRTHNLESRLQSQRLKSFEPAMEEFADRQSYTPALRYALAGFVFVSGQRGTESYIKCPFCGLAVRKMHSSQSPLLWHKILSKNKCIFIVRNVAYDKHDIVKLTIQPGQSSMPTNNSRNPQDEANLTIHGNDQLVTGSGASGDSEDLSNLTISAGMPNSELKEIYKRYSTTLLYLVSGEFIPALTNFTPQGGLDLPSPYYETTRRLTFTNWPKEQVISGRSLAKVGFQYTGRDDEVECVFCKVKVSGWTAEMDPLRTHIQKHPPCPLVQGSLLATNIPDTMSDIVWPTAVSQNMSVELGIITDSSVYPGFAVPTRREDSFLTWPVENKKLAAEMSESMLFYSGHGDECVCFSCGVKMSNWSEQENVWHRHARMSPHCQLLLQEKGQEFIDFVLEEYGTYHQGGRTAVINVVTTRMIRPRMDSNVAQAVLALYPKYSRDEVKNALIDNIKYGGQDFRTTEPLIVAILDKRDEQRRLNIARTEADDSIDPPEIVQLPQLDDIENVETDGGDEAGAATTANNDEEETTLTDTQQEETITPTGAGAAAEEEERGANRPENSVACCVSCAPAMVTCPLCRHDVNGTIRIHFDKL